MNSRLHVKTFLLLLVVALAALALVVSAASKPAAVNATGWTWDDSALTHSS